MKHLLRLTLWLLAAVLLYMGGYWLLLKKEYSAYLDDFIYAVYPGMKNSTPATDALQKVYAPLTSLQEHYDAMQARRALHGEWYGVDGNRLTLDPDGTCRLTVGADSAEFIMQGTDTRDYYRGSFWHEDEEIWAEFSLSDMGSTSSLLSMTTIRKQSPTSAVDAPEGQVRTMMFWRRPPQREP